MLRLKDKYKKQAIKEMREKFGYRNEMAVPRIEKVVVNTSFGRMISGKTDEEARKISNAIVEDLAQICGQKPILTKAKKSISSFKIRQGMPLGAKTTLRKDRMYDFLERVIHVALPRSRDFRGIDTKSIDKKGNLTIGIREQIIFPEILAEKTKFIFGFEIVVKTTAKDKEKGIELLRLLGFPIKK